MFKKLATIVAAAMLTLSASSAFAAFADLDLIRVYYNRAGGAEVATELGSISSLLSTGGSQTLAGSFGAVPTTGYVAYFALDRTTNELWASGSTTVSSVINGSASGLTGIKNSTTLVYSLYNSVEVGNTATVATSDANSYRTRLSATQGTLNAAINNATRLNTELSLANLATANTQTLYYWSNALTTVAGEKIGVNVATIITNADGTTTFTSNVATPIPAAAYLLGSGLLGLVGLRRRNNA